MDPELWQTIERIFQSALERRPEDRSAYLDEACGDDHLVRREVESLISADNDARGLRGASDVEAATVSARYDQSASLVGERLGAYIVIREIGRGGMGKVLLAAPSTNLSETRVAIKLIKRGMDSSHISLRFNTERQILAKLDHPNIARLIDGGTTDDGTPYFVMEYIQGKRLIEYCDAHKLNITARLKLLLNVCSAVQYAHQHSIVHRDIKPGNILVTDSGVPKLLDFGIAKLLRPDPTLESIVLTPPGMRLMTVDYASPEQIKGESLTTATDVYSLGVVLYELLTGHWPYRPKSGSLEDIIRAICEQQPEKPSVVINRVEEVIKSDSRGAIRVTPESVSSVREVHPDRLRRRLAGDIDKVALKALHKDVNIRYKSAEELSEDIQRHLKGAPVLATETILSSAARDTAAEVGDGRQRMNIKLSDVRSFMTDDSGADREAAHWREVRSYYQRCASTLRELRDRHLLDGSDAESLKRITRSIESQIVRCDELLAKLKE